MKAETQHFAAQMIWKLFFHGECAEFEANCMYGVYAIVPQDMMYHKVQCTFHIQWWVYDWTEFSCHVILNSGELDGRQEKRCICSDEWPWLWEMHTVGGTVGVSHVTPICTFLVSDFNFLFFLVVYSPLSFFLIQCEPWQCMFITIYKKLHLCVCFLFGGNLILNDFDENIYNEYIST